MTISGHGTIGGKGTHSRAAPPAARLLLSSLPTPGTIAAGTGAVNFVFTATFLNAQGQTDTTATFTVSSSNTSVATVSRVNNGDGTATITAVYVGTGRTFLTITGTNSVPLSVTVKYRLGAAILFQTQGGVNIGTIANLTTTTLTLSGDQRFYLPTGTAPHVHIGAGNNPSAVVQAATYDGTNTTVTFTGTVPATWANGQTLVCDNFIYDPAPVIGGATRVWIPSPPAPLDPPLVKPAGAFDITTYGADPTGATDSQPGIAAAVAAAQANGPGSVVWWPDGDYSVQSAGAGSIGVLVPAGNNVIMAGTGRDRVFCTQAGAMGHLYANQCPLTITRDITFDTATVFNDPLNAQGSTNGTNATACALASRVDGASSKGIGILGGPAVNISYLGNSTTVHSNGVSGDDTYVDGGGQLQNADVNINNQNNMVWTRTQRWGGDCNPFFCTGLDWENDAYHPSVRSNRNGRSFHYTHCDGVLIVKNFDDWGSFSGGDPTVPNSTSTYQGAAVVTIDGYTAHVTGSNFIIGDVLSPGSILVKNSQFQSITTQPFNDIVGTWDSSNPAPLGTASCQRQGGTGPTHFTGFPGGNC
jgi:Pectate lyase superfamily protein